MSNTLKTSEFDKLDYCSLEEVVDILDGQRKPIKQGDRISGNIPYYGATGVIDFVNDYIFDDDLVLVGEDGENIKSRVLPMAFKISGKSWVNNHAHVLKPHSINLDFLMQYLNIIDYTPYITGTAQPKLNQQSLRKIKILNLPLAEQKKIAEILSSVDAAIEKTEQLIAKTEEVKKGLMQQLLTKGIGHTEFKQTEIGEIPVEWEISLLGDVVERIVGGGTPSRDIEDYYEGDIPWFTVKDMVGIYLSQSQEYITEDAIQNSATNLIEENNVIVATRIGLGKAFINQCDIAINQDLKALFPKKDIISTEYLLLSILGQAEKIIGMGSGTTVKGIRLEQLKKLNILLPPLKEQQRIISIFNQIEQKLGNESNQYNLLVNLKHGLMQQLLTGQVRVKLD